MPSENRTGVHTDGIALAIGEITQRTQLLGSESHEKLTEFPEIEVPVYVPQMVSIETQTEIIEAIPWERRGAFLAAATEALRVGEIRAFDLSDVDGVSLRATKAVQGPRIDAPIADRTKNNAGEVRTIWHPELQRWIEWRLEQATPAARLRGEVALFWNPTARNIAKRWTPEPMREEWRAACEKVGVSIPLQQGTRHTTLTALGGVLPERVLRAFSRHKDAKSLDRYSKPQAAPGAIVQALVPTLYPPPKSEEKT